MILYYLPTGTCGVDTNVKLTTAGAKAFALSTILGQPLKFVFRYVSLGAPSAADITADERDMILGAGLCLGLVQHVRYPGWVAAHDNGDAQGRAAATHAQLVGYPAGAHLGLDMEGLKNVGQEVVDYVTAWAAAVHAAGYKVLLYVGYACGLSQGQLAALQDSGVVDLFWSDFGPRTLPPGKVFAMKQHVQTYIAGVAVDPDDVRAEGIGVMAPDSMDAGLVGNAHEDTKTA